MKLARKLHGEGTWALPLFRGCGLTGPGLFFIAGAALFYIQAFRESAPASRNMLVMLASGLSALLAISLPWGWLHLRRLRVRRETPQYFIAGAVSTIHYLLFNRRRLLPAFRIRIREVAGEGTSPGQVDGMTGVVSPGKGQRIGRPVVFARRGRFVLAEVEIESSFPFGLLRFRRRRALREEVLVYPRPFELPPWLRRELVGQAMEGESGVSRRGFADVAGVREYVAGESIGRIHWPTTARSGALMLFELERHEGGRVAIILDTAIPETSGNLHGDLERLVSLAAGLVRELHLAGHPFSFQCLGRDLNERSALNIEEGGGVAAFHALMEVLALTTSSRLSPTAYLGQAIANTPHGAIPVILTREAPSVIARVPGVAEREYLVLSTADHRLREALRRRSVEDEERP